MIHLVVRGNPKALKRHRTFRTKSGQTFQYDPSKVDKKDFLVAIQEKAPKSPFSGPICMNLYFFMPRPKSHYRTGKFAGILKDSAPLYHTSKPDLDNLIKFVKDAMEGVFFRNDSQVCIMDPRKYYDEVPRTEIWIEEINETAKNKTLSFV